MKTTHLIIITWSKPLAMIPRPFDAPRSSFGRRRALVLLMGTLLLGGAAILRTASAQSTSTAAPDAAERWRALQSEAINPGIFFASVGAGTGAHLGDEPAAWPETVGGYAARVGSSAGGELLQIGGTHALAASLRLDIRYRPRRHEGMGDRLRHAVLSPLLARTPSGARVPNLPNAAGTYAGALAQTRWEQGEWAPQNALTSTAVSLGFDVVVNLIRALTGPSSGNEAL